MNLSFRNTPSKLLIDSKDEREKLHKVGGFLRCINPKRNAITPRLLKHGKIEEDVNFEEFLS